MEDIITDEAVRRPSRNDSQLSLEYSEQPERVSRSDSHKIAVSSFETGNVEHIDADEIVLCVPTKDCVQFWATIAVCAFVIIISIIGISLLDVSDAKFQICVGFFGLAWGVLVPSPNYATAFKKPAP